MSRSFGVVDLFAGPGGLGEGFASLNINGHHPFKIVISVEKEASAHRTLELRAFIRNFLRNNDSLPKPFVDFHAGRIPEPDWSQVDSSSWKLARLEARKLELGLTETTQTVDQAIARSRSTFDDTILIGGPPCQAYSLVGRSRSKGIIGYRPADDERHFLFREYISVVRRLMPGIFVMENVKGILSSTVESKLVFEILMNDLRSLGKVGERLYELRAITVQDGTVSLGEALKPSDFVVRAEQFGVPQRRHRVFIIGLRRDVAEEVRTKIRHGIRIDRTLPVASCANDVLGKLPKLRSGVSKSQDSFKHWHLIVKKAANQLSKICAANADGELATAFIEVKRLMGTLDESVLKRSSHSLPTNYATAPTGIRAWLERPNLEAFAQHESRAHMPSDLVRYLYAAVYGYATGLSPKASDFPEELAPAHQNWGSGIFNDRFRVQLSGEPSTTITSHIAKDGHYFIHPDPLQCRSLTVREAARLQTFPDDYFFLGNRTEQYVQVGNAVPPYLAGQIAHLLFRCLEGESTGVVLEAGSIVPSFVKEVVV